MPRTNTKRAEILAADLEMRDRSSTLAPTIAPDDVISFEINPGTLLQFLETRAEGGPRLKCFEGSVTLVSPGTPHEDDLDRLTSIVFAIFWELEIEHSPLRSRTWTLPVGAGDTAYEPDAAYYIQSYGQTKKGQPPDLAIEVVVSHPATKALRAGAFLQIPELWVLDIPRHRLTFYHLATRGKHKGTYRPSSLSRAFPFVTSAEILDRLDDPETGGRAFHANCRAWARQVLLPRFRAENGGA
jgi:Uma2 family endonuclease